MSRSLNFAKRNVKEILRDPLSVIFALALPMFLLFIFQQFKIPSEIYSISNFTPGILIFGLSFITMFTATLVAKDRCSSLLMRLSASPMREWEYLAGYVLALLPCVLLQNVLFFAMALLLGLAFSLSVLLTVLTTMLISVLYILLGILIGCVCNENGAPGVSSVVIQLVAFTSGMYFDTSMVGGFFRVLCQVLPFAHSLTLLKQVLNGGESSVLLSIIVVVVYTVTVAVASSVLFIRKMHGVK